MAWKVWVWSVLALATSHTTVKRTLSIADEKVETKREWIALNKEADLLFLSKFSFNSKWKNTIKVRPVRQSIRRTEINIPRGWQPDRFPFSKSCRLTFGAGRGSMRFSISCRPNVGPRKQLWKCRCVLMLFRVLQSSLRLYPKTCKRYMPFSIIDGQP